METLLERTNEALEFIKIDPNDLIRAQNLYRTIPGNNGPTIVGTILEYFNKDGVRTYAVYTTTGWMKEWAVDKGDILDMIWSMEYNDFSYGEIAQILNITEESAEMKHKEACERKCKLGDNYDDVNFEATTKSDIFERGLAACTVLGVDPNTVIKVRSIEFEKHNKTTDTGIVVETNDCRIGVLIGDFNKCYKKTDNFRMIKEMRNSYLDETYISQILDTSLNTVKSFMCL